MKFGCHIRICGSEWQMCLWQEISENTLEYALFIGKTIYSSKKKPTIIQMLCKKIPIKKMSSHFCRNAFCFSHCARFFFIFYTTHEPKRPTKMNNSTHKKTAYKSPNRTATNKKCSTKWPIDKILHTTNINMDGTFYKKKETNSNGKYNQNDRCQQFYLLFYAHTMFKGIKNRIKIEIDSLCVSIYFLCTLLFPQHPSHTTPISSSVFFPTGAFFLSWLFSKYKMIGNKKHLSIRTIWKKIKWKNGSDIRINIDPNIISHWKWWWCACVRVCVWVDTGEW